MKEIKIEKPPEVLYRLRWQVAGYPENEVIGRYESISLVSDLLKDRGVNKIQLEVMGSGPSGTLSPRR